MSRQRQNDDEVIAQKWLKAQGYGDIRKQCNNPPDFVVDGKLAVEVTRLNQRINGGSDNHSKGEEEVRIPLTDQIKKTIEQLGSPGNEGRSWNIDCEYDFSVRLPNRRTVKTQISDALEPLLKPYDDSVIKGMWARHFDSSRHAEQSLDEIGYPHLCLECGICLDLTEVPHSPEKFFVSNVSDGKGIIVADEMKISAQNIIREKSKKIREQKKIGAYESWWLILVDHVCLAPMQMLSEHELSFVRDQDFDFWDRVVMVSSQNVNWYYDLPR